MSQKFSDKEIVDGCKKSNPVYQRALVMQYSELLFATSLRYLKDEEEAKDILQDSFMKIFKAVAQYDSDRGSFAGWMCKIVINESLKKWHKRKEKVSFNDYFENATAPAFAVDKLKTDELYELIRQLDDPYKMVFNLHVVEGYPHKEISEMLGIKIGSSRSILSRAKEMLRLKINSIKIKESWV